MHLLASKRKKNLCDLLLTTGGAFVRETSGRAEEDAALRSELDCLLALWAAGAIDPVAAFSDYRATRRADSLKSINDVCYR